MIDDVLVNRFKKRAARGSCDKVFGSCENLLEIYDSIWYRGSRVDDENNRLTTGASTALSATRLSLTFRLDRYKDPTYSHSVTLVHSYSCRPPLRHRRLWRRFRNISSDLAYAGPGNNSGRRLYHAGCLFGARSWRRGSRRGGDTPRRSCPRRRPVSIPRHPRRLGKRSWRDLPVISLDGMMLAEAVQSAIPETDTYRESW